MRTLQGKTLFITGGSRGIGRAIALRAATDGANVVIAAKTADPHVLARIRKRGFLITRRFGGESSLKAGSLASSMS